MKKSAGVSRSLLICQNCGKRFDAYESGQAKAAKHAEACGHIVKGDLLMKFNFNGRI